MIDIEVYIKEILIENLIQELEKEFDYYYPKDEHRTEAIELIAIAFHQYDDELNEVFLNRLNSLKKYCNDSVVPLVLEAFYYFHNDDFNNALMYLNYSIEVTNGTLNRYLTHLYQYIKLSDVPKTLEDDILTDLKEFISQYGANMFSFQSLAWDINITLPDNYPLRNLIKISDMLIEKNSMEADLYFFQFHVFMEFKQWERLLDSSREYVQKYPRSNDLSSVYSYMAKASFELGKFVKAIQYYRNSIECPTQSNDDEKVLADALNYKMSAIYCLQIAKQRNYNPSKSYELLGWYRKAHDMFRKAMKYIDSNDSELYEKAIQTKLIVDGMEYIN